MCTTAAAGSRILKIARARSLGLSEHQLHDGTGLPNSAQGLAPDQGHHADPALQQKSQPPQEKERSSRAKPGNRLPAEGHSGIDELDFSGRK